MMGTELAGTGINVIKKDGQDSSSVAQAAAESLINTDNVQYIVGAGGSLPSGTAVPCAVGGMPTCSATRAVPVGSFFASSAQLRGCTDAQLNDPAITKYTTYTATPAANSCWNNNHLVVNTLVTSATHGIVPVMWLQDARSGRTTDTTVAVIYRNDGMGKPAATSFAASWAAAGGGRNVVASVPYPTTGLTTALAQTIIQTALGCTPMPNPTTCGNPTSVVLWARIGELVTLINGYTNMDTDHPGWPKPANYDSLFFVVGGTLMSDYSSMGPAGIAVLHNQTVGLQPDADPDFEGFKRWQALALDWNPTYQYKSHLEARAFDAFMIWGLAAIAAGSTDPLAMAAQVPNVVNPPGEIVYPGDWAKARSLILSGQKVNYECALHACDFDTSGQMLVTTYVVWQAAADGSPTVITRIPVNQPL